MLTDEDHRYIATTYHGMVAEKRGFMNINGSTECTWVVFPNTTTADDYVNTMDIDLYNAHEYNPNYSLCGWSKALLIHLFDGISFTEKHMKYQNGNVAIRIADDFNNDLYTHPADKYSLSDKYLMGLLMILYYDFEKDEAKKEKLLEIMKRAFDHLS